MSVAPESVLFITLDSCRYDTFQNAKAPHLKSVAPLHRAKAPSHFTYGSHAAMFMGFTPSVPGAAQPYLDSKYVKVFRLGRLGFAGSNQEAFRLDGASIAQGFERLGHHTIGTGAVSWFDPESDGGRHLARGFGAFYYPGCGSFVRQQMAWLRHAIDEAAERPVFAFLNVGETHVPYYHDGASWSALDNPCLPYQSVDRAQDCRIRQRACLEYVDGQIGPLLALFWAATILICADHGDCWGEDGLWEHGVSHEMTLTVPLLIRLRGRPVGAER